MNDIIERLRHAADCQWKDVVDDCQEAADEIELLQQAEQDALEINEQLLAWKDRHSRTEGGECPYCEIDRLKAALEEIAKRTCPASCDNIAREALEEDES